MAGDKTKMTHVRLTEAEHAHIERQTAKYGIKTSEYLRRLVEQDMGRISLNDMGTKESLLQRKALINEINHIGVNINQIAHNVNSGKYLEYEKKKLFAMMEKIQKLLEGVITGEN